MNQSNRTPDASRARRRAGRAGFTLLEMILCIVIIASVLLPLSDAVTRATLDFADRRNGLDGHDIANRIMSVLASEEFPNYEGDSTAVMAGHGTYLSFMEDILQQDTSSMSEPQLAAADAWEYEFRKEILLINTKGTYKPLESDDGVSDEPDFGDEDYDDRASEASDAGTEAPPTPDDLRKLQAARVIRITLTLYLPGKRDQVAENPEYAEGGTAATDPRRIVLVTMVDADDFKESRPEEATDESKTGSTTGNTTGGNTSSARSGRGGSRRPSMTGGRR
jgi:prepilin-type N-terminal cleavage/methylation domain-containing protein